MKLRCMGCERSGQLMNQEHMFPRWLIDYAPARKEGITWRGKKGVSPLTATIPICKECNDTLGMVLEGPVAAIFRAIDGGESLSDKDLELLVRWMWKFEGFEWHLNYAGDPHARYTEAFTLIERVATDAPFAQVRRDMAVAISRIKANDEGFEDWPLGLDMPPSENALSMSGVFGRVAIITFLSIFADAIPKQFGVYRFADARADRDEKVFLPPLGFDVAFDAINATIAASLELMMLHDEFGREERQRRDLLWVPRRRVELPPV